MQQNMAALRAMRDMSGITRLYVSIRACDTALVYVGLYESPTQGVCAFDGFSQFCLEGKLRDRENRGPHFRKTGECEAACCALGIRGSPL